MLVGMDPNRLQKFEEGYENAKLQGDASKTLKTYERFKQFESFL